MNKINLIDSFSEFKEFKNIDRPTMMSILEDIFRAMIIKRFAVYQQSATLKNGSYIEYLNWEIFLKNFPKQLILHLPLQAH